MQAGNRLLDTEIEVLLKNRENMFNLLCRTAIENRLHDKILINLAFQAKYFTYWDLDSEESIIAASLLLRYGQPHHLRSQILLGVFNEFIIQQFFLQIHQHYKNYFYLEFRFPVGVGQECDRFINLLTDSQ